MINQLRLPLTFDPARLKADLAQIMPGEWMPHFNNADYEGEWSGVALRSVGGAVSQLYPDPTAQDRFADTPLLARCPYFQEVLARLPFPHEAVRLLKLKAGSNIREHRDYKLGYEEGFIRLHLPIETNSDVAFYLEGQRVEMQPGECWYLNFSLPHRVENHSLTDRIHLVIDGRVNDWVHSLFATTKNGTDPVEIEPDVVTSSFDIPLAHWNLPWSQPVVPPYREVSLGPWTIKKNALIPQMSYFQDSRVLSNQYVLYTAEQTWMSTAPLEIESNAPHIAAARGHTVVMGAGLGLALYNILLKPNVSRVTLVERDPAVIALLHAAADLSTWPGFEKLTVKLMDAFDYTPDAGVDHLYVDIWTKTGDPQALPDIQRLYRQVQAETVSWWSQEIHFLRWLEERGYRLSPTPAHYAAWAAEIKLPLIESDSSAYLTAITQMARSVFYQTNHQQETGINS